MRPLQVFSLIFIIGCAGTLFAQNNVLAQANNELTQFEAQYHSGANNAQLYETLYKAYKGYMQVAEKNPNDRAALAGLRKIYPYLIHGAVYFSSNNNQSRAYDFATAYIDMPSIPAFKMERFSRDNQYPTFCYFAASEAYNNRQYDDAIHYFNCYIESGDQTYLQKSRTFLTNSYYAKLNSLIDRKDYSKALQVCDEFLSLYPNDTKVLFTKARILASQNDYEHAIPLYRKLYRQNSSEINVCSAYAISSYNYAMQLMEDGKNYQAKEHLETAAGISDLLCKGNIKEEQKIKFKKINDNAKGWLADINRSGGNQYYASTTTPSNGSSQTVPSNSGNNRTSTVNKPQSSHEHISFAELPSYTEFVKSFVEDGVYSWQKKDDYETMNEYKLRVTEQTREAKIQQLVQIATNKYISEYGSRISIDNLRLGKYDAENGVFPITSPDFGDMLLPVPRTNNEARSFEQQWATVSFENPQFCIVNDKLALAQLSFCTTTGKRYIYNNKAQLTYNNTTIEYNFDKIDVDEYIADNNNNQPASGAKIVNNNVSFGKSDVDIDIPESKKKDENLFALIFANEQYENESNVSFAHNDGTAFKNYCIKTLGCNENNVHFVKDATLGNIRREIRWIKNIAETYDGEASILLYYAGHGVPDEASKSAYLLPTDGMSTDIQSGYKLDDLYATLGNLPAKNVTVFLDACFSGAQRSGDPMESKKDSRAPIIKPKESVPQGKMVVLSAATGDETAFPYKEQQHGLFTYFLLKKLKESKGDVSYGELADYINKNVKRNSLTINNKLQTPTTMSSPSITEQEWRKWKFRN